MRTFSFRSILLAMCLLLVATLPALAKGGTTLGAYELGYNLSLGLLGSARGANGGAFLTKAQGNASELGVKLPALPKFQKDSTKDTVAAMGYLLKDMKPIAKSLERKKALALEIGIKSNLMRLLYSPGEDRGLGKVLATRCQSLGMPATATKALTDAVARKAPSADISKALTQLDKDVRAFAKSH